MAGQPLREDDDKDQDTLEEAHAAKNAPTALPIRVSAMVSERISQPKLLLTPPAARPTRTSRHGVPCQAVPPAL